MRLLKELLQKTFVYPKNAGTDTTSTSNNENGCYTDIESVPATNVTTTSHYLNYYTHLDIQTDSFIKNGGDPMYFYWFWYVVW